MGTRVCSIPPACFLSTISKRQAHQTICSRQGRTSNVCPLPQLNLHRRHFSIHPDTRPSAKDAMQSPWISREIGNEVLPEASVARQIRLTSTISSSSETSTDSRLANRTRIALQDDEGVRPSCFLSLSSNHQAGHGGNQTAGSL